MARKCGRTVCFHGGYNSKAAAQAKANSKTGAVVLKRRIHGRTRYVVVTPKG